MVKLQLNQISFLNTGDRLEKVKAVLWGPFRLCDETGVDLLPPAKKSRVLVAVLLLSENMQQSRVGVIDLLWGDRGREQGMASLRQSLNDIRQSFGAHRNLLKTDRKSIALNKDLIDLDLDAPRHGAELLEDLEASGPEIRLWLRRQRALRDGPISRSNAPFVQIRKRPESLYTDALADGISNTIFDWCAERIVVQDKGHGPSDGHQDNLAQFIIDNRVLEGQSKIAGRTTLSDSASAAQLWSQFQTLDQDPVQYLEEAGLYRLINRTVDKTVFDLSTAHRNSAEGQTLQMSTLGAVHMIFRNRGDDLDIAKRQLQNSFENCNRGVYLAWMAYILTFYAAERPGSDLQALRDEARALVARALELESGSAMVLALCAYVNSFMLGNRAAGHELATQAIEANRANPLAWIFRGAANFLSGEADKAYEDIAYARNIAGYGPYSYVIDMYACIAATLTNRFDEAIQLGEKSSMRSPEFKAPLRYLATLYAAKGDDQNLMQVVDRMKRLEPEFSLESLRDMSYPIPALRHSEALRAILRDAS